MSDFTPTGSFCIVRHMDFMPTFSFDEIRLGILEPHGESKFGHPHYYGILMIIITYVRRE